MPRVKIYVNLHPLTVCMLMQMLHVFRDYIHYIWNRNNVVTTASLVEDEFK